MLDFYVDVESCISCGQCASDCPAMIISMESGTPTIDPELETYCIGCLHCAAICSESSISLLGYTPEKGTALKKAVLPSPEQFELLVKARRTTRNYQQRNVEQSLIEKAVEVASHAPSGHNDRGLQFSVINDIDVTFSLREKVYTELGRLLEGNDAPEEVEMFRDIVIAFREGKKDILFRNAPHLLLVSAHQESASPLHDSVIALTTFELYCSANSLGTVWNGLMTLVLSEVLPDLKKELGISTEYELGYVMGFGHPAVWYQRSVQREVPQINFITAI